MSSLKPLRVETRPWFKVLLLMNLPNYIVRLSICVLVNTATGCKKDDCPDCVLRIEKFELKDIKVNGQPLQEATYSSHEILVVVDEVVQGRQRYLFEGSASKPFTGLIPVAKDAACNAYRAGTNGAYEWCPVSDSPVIEIDYFQARNGLPALSGIFTPAAAIKPRSIKSYTNIHFVSGDITLLVDMIFTNSPYK